MQKSNQEDFNFSEREIEGKSLRCGISLGYGVLRYCTRGTLLTRAFELVGGCARLVHHFLKDE
jgi:hypothetical protein